MIRSKILCALSIITLSVSDAKIMRNNALMTKMVSNFRNENDISEERERSETVMTRMQNVLCKNFPTIPCDIILQDKMLQKLIERSIQQLNNKRQYLEQTTRSSIYLTLFPAFNSEDLSNFPQARNKKEKRINSEKHKHKEKEKRSKKSKKSKRTSVYNRKKIRKFYPHKVKYRDKAANKLKELERNDEQLSMSVEVPDVTMKRHQIAYKMQPDEAPVWRIDYMKHGEPNMNMFGFDDGYKGIIKTGPKVVEENVREETARRDVLQPDVYINRDFVRKNSITRDGNSEAVD